jgi:hypothetical protein
MVQRRIGEPITYLLHLALETADLGDGRGPFLSMGAGQISLRQMKLPVLPLRSEQTIPINDHTSYFRCPIEVGLLLMISKARRVDHLLNLPDNLSRNASARERYIVNIDS